MTSATFPRVPLFLAFLLLSPAAVADWPQFRGPDRTGLSPETGLIDPWPEGGPPIVWRRDIGEGFTGLVLQDGKLFTAFAEADKEFLGRFDAATGEEVWRVELGERFQESFGNGPRSTPTLDGGTIYALGARGRLVAVDVADGAIQWSLDLFERYGIFDTQVLVAIAPTPQGERQLPFFGYASSPLVVDDLLIVDTGARHGKSLVALRKANGEEVWTALDSEVGYTSPTLVETLGQRQILMAAGTELVGLAPADGRVLWRHPWAATLAQPLLVPPAKVFASAANDVGAVMVQLREGPEGIQTEELWRTRRLKNAWNSSVIVGDRIYGFDNATLRCVDVDTGELLWARRGLGQGTLIHADGKLIALSDRGKVFVGRATDEGFEELGSLQVLEGRSWTPMSLADGILYLRNQSQMAALDLRATATPAPKPGETP